MIMKTLQLFHSIVLLATMSLLSSGIDSNPRDRVDVMAVYHTSNSLRCKALCWYSKPCSSYSYDFAQNPADNCVLHAALSTTSTSPTPASEGSWRTVLAGASGSDSQCRPRPCPDWSVCVPVHGGSHYCTAVQLAQCGDPPTVSHGSVTTTGSQQGDTAEVSCDQSYVNSPKSAPTELTCQGTSQWTLFEGECVPYEFNYPGGISSFERDLPWPLEDTEICVEGVITGKGFAYVDLMSSLSATLIDFRLQIFTWWSTSLHWTQNYPRASNKYKQSYHIRNLKMGVGDTIRLSISLWYDSESVTVEEKNTLARGVATNHAWNSYNITQTKAIAVSGLINITYINLLYGC